MQLLPHLVRKQHQRANVLCSQLLSMHIFMKQLSLKVIDDAFLIRCCLVTSLKLHLYADSTFVYAELVGFHIFLVRHTSIVVNDGLWHGCL